MYFIRINFTVEADYASDPSVPAWPHLRNTFSDIHCEQSGDWLMFLELIAVGVQSLPRQSNQDSARIGGVRSG
jgi:hypothetical protein